MNKFKYLGAFIIPFVVFLCIKAANNYSWLSIVFIFVLIPFIELFTKGSETNIESTELQNDKYYDIIVYLMVPVQFGLLYYYFQQINIEGLSTFVKLSLAISMGFCCSALGINVAHELGHRHSNIEQRLAHALLMTSLYMHFFIEHNRGHHKNVSTLQDAATARYGENLYSFYFRSISCAYISAFNLEKTRLNKLGKSTWHYSNQFLQFQIIQIIFLASIFLIYNSNTLFYFVISAIVGILMLETVNYIEHYGLSRKVRDGILEKASPIHSWNSNHPLGRIMLFELSRHSDHHYMPSRKYQLLKHHDNSPQLPTGYPGMMLLSMFPPIWFRVMHKLMEK